MILGGSPAGATVVDRGHFADSYSNAYDDCGFDVLVQGTATASFRIRAGKGKTDTAFFGLENVSYGETHTNADTGAFITITGNSILNEIKATRVERDIFEFEAVEAGQPFAVDSAGKLVLRDRAPCTITPCSTRAAMTSRAAN